MNRLSVIILFLLLMVSPQVFAQQNAPQPLQPHPGQQLFDEQVKKLKWKDIAVEFRPVTDKAAKGSQPMVVKSTDQENGKTYHVAKNTILALKDVSNMDVTYNPNDINMLRLMLRFDENGKKTLEDYTTKHLGEKMGVLIDGQLRLVANIRQPLNNGRVQVYGLTPTEAVDIVQRYYKPKLELARQIEELQNKK
jgi:preprotein translocase subunit SecD